MAPKPSAWNFGQSIAIDGDRALIGAPGDSSNGSLRGAAYVYEYDGAQWNEASKLAPTNASDGDRVGTYIAIHDDILAIGTGVISFNATASVFIYERVAGTWEHTATISSEPYGGGTVFGRALAVRDGQLFIGHRNAVDDQGQNVGAVYVFEKVGASWTEVDRLQADDGSPSDAFGSSIALDGQTLVIGAHSALSDDQIRPGAAYVFARENGVWTQQQRLDPINGVHFEGFGFRSVVDGGFIAVSSPLADESAGATYAFELDSASTSWTQVARLVAPDARPDARFGNAMDINGEGLVVAAPWHGPANHGGVYLFDLAAAKPCQVDATCPASNEGCCTERVTPGCCDSDCCSAVCEQRPSCCTVEWDDLCVTLASDLCPAIGCTAGAAYCRGNCGGVSNIGCWCDNACPEFGDCCPDWCDSCPDIWWCDETGSPGATSCVGKCGGNSGSNCWCDEMCFHYGDCCNDVCTACGSLRGCNDLDPHSCPEPVLGDLNGDGVVDVSDLLILLTAWGPCPREDACPADLNNDGSVDVGDLLILLSTWS